MRQEIKCWGEIRFSYSSEWQTFLILGAIRLLKRDLYLFDCICLPFWKSSGNLKLLQLYRKHSHLISTDFVFVEIRGDGSSIWKFTSLIVRNLFEFIQTNRGKGVTGILSWSVCSSTCIKIICIFKKTTYGKLFLKTTCGKLQLRATPPPSSAVKLRQSSPECRPVNTSCRNCLWSLTIVCSYIYLYWQVSIYWYPIDLVRSVFCLLYFSFTHGLLLSPGQLNH